MNERLLDRVLVWSLVGFLIEGLEQGTEAAELVLAYGKLVLTSLGVGAEEAHSLCGALLDDPGDLAVRHAEEPQVQP